MSHADNVIDFTLFRKRKHAQQMGRWMWALYAQQAGLVAQHGFHASAVPKAPRQA
ncbi:hypothetical protein ACK56M_13520 [Pseudomonas sp. s4]|uniref:hypothetical protein n=1 Tax=Pseudomonas sp. s4 TaxID=353218 RepID=UPI00398C954E